MSREGTKGRFAPLVIVVISLGWLFSLGVGAIQKNWDALTVTTPVMLLVAGYAFGISITRTTEEGSDKGDFNEK